MPVQYYCSSCHKKLSISRSKIGDWVPCPVCDEVTLVPSEDQQEPPSAVLAPSAATSQASAREVDEPIVFPRTERDSSIPPSEVQSPPMDEWLTASDESEVLPLQFRRRFGDQEEMDLTPMVDVTFLLLIFFMITASFTLEKTIPTPVPDPNEQSASQPIQQQDDLLEKSIQIEILSDNSIALDDEPIPDPSLLRDRLSELMQRDQKAEALVKVADAALQETVVYVLDTANTVGMQRIRLAASEE